MSRLVPILCAALLAVAPAPLRAADPPAAPLVVALDPGHGGFDPGAEGEGVTEAALMLAVARALAKALEAEGIAAVLTRETDAFVPLEARITRARAAGAGAFLSLHADAVAEGRASGATVYTLSQTASDAASAQLAASHDRADLIAGADLGGQDDTVAVALMDLARTDTAPRSEALADAVAAGIGRSVGGLHKRPRLAADFSVLRAPDIPSALVELGFISSAADRDRLTSETWRAKVAEGIAAAVADWARSDAARARRLRQ